MKSRMTLHWPRSSRSWPPVELGLEPPRWLAWSWLLWCVALGLGLWLGCDLDAGCRAALAAAVAVARWQGYRQLRRSGVSRRLRWEPDGRWRLDGDAGPVTYVQPGPPRRLGAMIWIRWREEPGGRYFRADGIVVEPKARSALKARTNVAGPSWRRSTQ